MPPPGLRCTALDFLKAPHNSLSCDASKKKLTIVLHFADQTEDVIDWDDDDTKPAAVTKKEDPKSEPAPAAEVEESPAVAAPAAVAEPAEPVAPTTEEAPKVDATPDEAPEAEGDTPAATAEKTAEEASFALGLNATDADAEIKKRAERAKRFGITVDAESDDVKKAERAKRFGVEENEVVKGLDEALPERRPKRGREHGDDGQGGAKRQSLDRRNGGRDNRQRGGRRHGGRGGGGGNTGGRPQRQGGGGAAPSRKNVLDDPTEKAKAEARAKRFAGGQ